MMLRWSFLDHIMLVFSAWDKQGNIYQAFYSKISPSNDMMSANLHQRKRWLDRTAQISLAHTSTGESFQINSTFCLTSNHPNEKKKTRIFFICYANITQLETHIFFICRLPVKISLKYIWYQFSLSTSPAPKRIAAFVRQRFIQCSGNLVRSKRYLNQLSVMQSSN